MLQQLFSPLTLQTLDFFFSTNGVNLAFNYLGRHERLRTGELQLKKK